MYRAECHAGISARTGQSTMQGFLHTQSTTQGFLSEIKADSRRNGLLLLAASATEMAEQNKKENEVPTLLFFSIM